MVLQISITFSVLFYIYKISLSVEFSWKYKIYFYGQQEKCIETGLKSGINTSIRIECHILYINRTKRNEMEWNGSELNKTC